MRHWEYVRRLLELILRMRELWLREAALHLIMVVWERILREIPPVGLAQRWLTMEVARDTPAAARGTQAMRHRLLPTISACHLSFVIGKSTPLDLS